MRCAVSLDWDTTRCSSDDGALQRLTPFHSKGNISGLVRLLHFLGHVRWRKSAFLQKTASRRWVREWYHAFTAHTLHVKIARFPFRSTSCVGLSSSIRSRIIDLTHRIVYPYPLPQHSDWGTADSHSRLREDSFRVISHQTVLLAYPLFLKMCRACSPARVMLVYSIRRRLRDSGDAGPAAHIMISSDLSVSPSFRFSQKDVRGVSEQLKILQRFRA